MKLYLLKRPNGAGYDELCEIVIRAASEKDARDMARRHDHSSLASGDWYDPARTTCEVIRVSGEAEVICADVREA